MSAPVIYAHPDCRYCRRGLEPYLGRWRSADPADWSECSHCGGEHAARCGCRDCVAWRAFRHEPPEAVTS